MFHSNDLVSRNHASHPATLARIIHFFLAFMVKSEIRVTKQRSPKNMPPATVPCESDDHRHQELRDCMRFRTTEATRGIYPEPELTAAIQPDRQADCHSRNIKEPRRDMISRFPSLCD
jgi:hypothetical protein